MIHIFLKLDPEVLFPDLTLSRQIVSGGLHVRAKGFQGAPHKRFFPFHDHAWQGKGPIPFGVLELKGENA